MLIVIEIGKISWPTISRIKRRQQPELRFQLEDIVQKAAMRPACIEVGDTCPMRVLLVEDEVRLADNLAAALRDGPGFAVDWAERRGGRRRLPATAATTSSFST
jgi:hypothetical protein